MRRLPKELLIQARATILKAFPQDYLHEVEEAMHWVYTQVHDFEDGAFFVERYRKTLRSLRQARYERNKYKELAESWMRDYDRLKEKYEPQVLVESQHDR